MVSANLAAARDGEMSRLSFGTLYELHSDAALRLAYLLTGQSAVAEDIVQEAFVRILGRFGNLRNREAFGAYLRSTVVNLAKNQSRSNSRQVLVSRLDDQISGTSERQMIEERDQLWQTLQRIPHRQRAAIILRYYEDLPYDQIADVLHCSRKAVKPLLSRALTSLRREVGEEEL